MGEGVGADGFLGLPGEPGGAGRVGRDDFVEIPMFGGLALLEERIAGAASD